MRKVMIAGNWKMNKTFSEGVELALALNEELKDGTGDVEVVVCPPAVDLKGVAEVIEQNDAPFGLGAQNVYWEEAGAYTGEISADMLVELGVTYVIIGHSERRQYFGETDQTVNARVKAALQKGLKPIICVGETLEEREGGKVEEVLVRQTTEALKDIAEAELMNIVVAYEPVWAIGTGKTATAEVANDTIKIIRDTIAKLYSKKTAEEIVRIQYGGSMNPKNVKELMAMPEIDGGLIGGASLKAPDFSLVVNY